MEITVDEFKTWLQAQPPDNYVGRSNTASYCPIATCLRDKGMKHPTVGHSEYGEMGKAASHELPALLQVFVTEVDRRGGGYLTATKALDLLKSVEDKHAKRNGRS